MLNQTIYFINFRIVINFIIKSKARNCVLISNYILFNSTICNDCKVALCSVALCIILCSKTVKSWEIRPNIHWHIMIFQNKTNLYNCTFLYRLQNTVPIFHLQCTYFPHIRTCTIRVRTNLFAHTRIRV